MIATFWMKMKFHRNDNYVLYRIAEVTLAPLYRSAVEVWLA